MPEPTKHHSSGSLPMKFAGRRWLLIVVGIVLCLGAGVGIVLLTRNDETTTATGASLRVSDDDRYLVDAAGAPWLMAADTAWSIFSQLTAGEVDQYLEARQRLGFNTVAASLVDPTSGGVQETVNLAGDHLFKNNSIAEPNDAFFNNVDIVVGKAQARGMQLIVVPLWLQHANRDPTFTPENAASFGAYVGNRYRSYPNIIWAVGGDYGSAQNEGLCPRQQEIRAMANGIKTADPNHLMTYHPGYGLSTSTCYADDQWVDFNSSYWNFNFDNVSSTYELVLNDYNLKPTKPALMIEAGYEGPHPTDANPDALTARTSRMQSYYMLLAGGLGFTYGANSTYYMNNDSPDAIRTWQQTLEIPGATQQGFVAKAFQARPWWTLTPDQDHQVVVEGYGTFGEQDYVTVGRAADGSLAMAYIPSKRTVGVDLSRMKGAVTAQWYDPTNGAYSSIDGSPLGNDGLAEFSTPGANSVGDDDWLLVLEA